MLQSPLSPPTSAFNTLHCSTTHTYTQLHTANWEKCKYGARTTFKNCLSLIYFSWKPIFYKCSSGCIWNVTVLYLKFESRSFNVLGFHFCCCLFSPQIKWQKMEYIHVKLKSVFFISTVKTTLLDTNLLLSYSSFSITLNKKEKRMNAEMWLLSWILRCTDMKH